MILFPCCKINLGLDVVAHRTDGYHDIETIMYPIAGASASSLTDSLEVVRCGAGVEFTCSGDDIYCPMEQNLVLRAARLMGVNGVRIHLHKCIPSGAGLGGGSADAAATIVALNQLFMLGLSGDEMEQIAVQLGSDAPFFIRHSPQLCSGRGEIMTPCNISLANYNIAIVKPSVSVSTAEAYAGIIPYKPAVSLAERIALPICEWRAALTNAFEPTIFARYPQLAVIKARLYDAGAVYASMSGSGSALFGIFVGAPEFVAEEGERVFLCSNSTNL